MRVAIVVPSLGDVNILWAFRFAHIVKHTSAQIDLFTSKHFKIDEARNRAVIEALKRNPTHILFWDGDCIPYLVQDDKLVMYPQIIDYMLSFQYPIVSAYYYTSKQEPNAFVVQDGKYMLYEIKPGNGISYVDVVGLGFCLIDARIFKLIDPPWFNYETKYELEGNNLKIFEKSEDISFFDKVREHGYKVMLLHNVFCKHIHKAFIMGRDKFELVKSR